MATGRLVLPIGAAHTEEARTPGMAPDSIDHDGDSVHSLKMLGQHEAKLVGDDMIPMNFRMALKTNAIGARKNAKPAKRQQFEQSVLMDLAKLLGVAQQG